MITNNHRNGRFVFSLLLGGAIAITSAVSVQADMARDGKKAAYFSQSGVAIPVPDTTIATATIAKGKKKYILEVEGIVNESTNNFTAIGLRGYVNGIAMEPTGAAYQTTEGCSTIQGCTAQGIWWVDLDVLELANPGSFIGLPLVVTMKSSVVGGAGTASVSLRARLVKP